MLRQDAQSAESRFAWIVQLTKTITNVPFAVPLESRATRGCCRADLINFIGRTSNDHPVDGLDPGQCRAAAAS